LLLKNKKQSLLNLGTQPKSIFCLYICFIHFDYSQKKNKMAARANVCALSEAAQRSVEKEKKEKEKRKKKKREKGIFYQKIEKQI
jgi:cbb3-type cytochrome oxidase subunit 3